VDDFRGKKTKAKAGDGGANIFLTRKFRRGPGFSEEKMKTGKNARVKNAKE
jgi:hypothetical protein